MKRYNLITEGFFHHKDGEVWHVSGDIYGGQFRGNDHYFVDRMLAIKYAKTGEFTDEDDEEAMSKSQQKLVSKDCPKCGASGIAGQTCQYCHTHINEKIKRYHNIIQEGRAREDGTIWHNSGDIWGAKYNGEIKYHTSKDEAAYWAKEGHDLVGDDEDEDDSGGKYRHAGDDIDDRQKKLILQSKKGHGVMQDPKTKKFMARPNPKEGGKGTWQVFDTQEEADDYRQEHQVAKSEKDIETFKKAKTVDAKKVKALKGHGNKSGVVAQLKGKTPVYYARPHLKGTTWKAFDNEKDAKAYFGSIQKVDDKVIKSGFLKGKKTDEVHKDLSGDKPIFYAKPNEQYGAKKGGWRAFATEAQADQYNSGRDPDLDAIDIGSKKKKKNYTLKTKSSKTAGKAGGKSTPKKDTAPPKPGEIKEPPKPKDKPDAKALKSGDSIEEPEDVDALEGEEHGVVRDDDTGAYYGKPDDAEKSWKVFDSEKDARYYYMKGYTREDFEKKQKTKQKEQERGV